MTATIAEGARKRLRLTHALVGPSSYRLDARPQDHGASWPAIRWRCRHALPSELAWAAPLLRGEPEPVVCGQEQAEALFRRLDSLPTTIQVSICCERRRPVKAA